MNKASDLKRLILKDYKTIKNFSNITGIKYNKLMIVFNKSNYKEDDFFIVRKAYDNTIFTQIPGDIKICDRINIRLCILRSFNSYKDFSRKHPQYNNVYITNIVKGNLKRETKKYNQLINILTRDYKFLKK